MWRPTEVVCFVRKQRGGLGNDRAPQSNSEILEYTHLEYTQSNSEISHCLVTFSTYFDTER